MHTNTSNTPNISETLPEKIADICESLVLLASLIAFIYTVVTYREADWNVADWGIIVTIGAFCFIPIVLAAKVIKSSVLCTVGISLALCDIFRTMIKKDAK